MKGIRKGSGGIMIQKNAEGASSEVPPLFCTCFQGSKVIL